jgi:hypothetical protein
VTAHPQRYGVAAEFGDAGELVDAARAVRAAGYRRFEAYSPYPIKELEEHIPAWSQGFLSPGVFAAGFAGALAGYYIQYFIAAIVYPTNIGGRPLNSWPAFVVITFEMAVLFAICAVFFGTLYFEGLPELYHPLFRIPDFKRVSEDGYFLCIEASDIEYHPTGTPRFLQSLEPLKIWEIDRE